MLGNGGGRCGVERAVEGTCKECVGGEAGGMERVWMGRGG